MPESPAKPLKPNSVQLLVDLLAEIPVRDFPSDLAAELALELVREFRDCQRERRAEVVRGPKSH